jgi:hypothetical protein
MNPRERLRRERLAQVEFRRSGLAEVDPKSDDHHLLMTQLDAIERQLRAGGLARADWEDHELHWQAHLSNLMTGIVAKSSQIMLAFEDMARQDPAQFDNDEDVKKLLRWWCEEGGREQHLGKIPIEERRRLEQMEAKWRAKREQGGG